MQLTSKRHSMVVEFRPHSILTDKFVYTLKFKDEVQSMRLFNKKEMVETVNSRLDIHGYTVTDFLTEPQQYMPASCWTELRERLNFSITSLTQMTDNIIDRDELQEAYIESIIDGMDHKTMYQFVYDSLNGNLDDYSVEELITEVKDYYPELLEQVSVSVTYGDKMQESSW